MYTFSDDTCQTPLTSVFPKQPQQFYPSPDPTSGCGIGGEPCCLASQDALYGPIALGFSFGKTQTTTPTTCTGKDMFTVYDIVRSVEGSCTAGSKIITWFPQQAAAACWPRPSRFMEGSNGPFIITIHHHLPAPMDFVLRWDSVITSTAPIVFCTDTLLAIAKRAHLALFKCPRCPATPRARRASQRMEANGFQKCLQILARQECAQMFWIHPTPTTSTVFLAAVR